MQSYHLLIDLIGHDFFFISQTIWMPCSTGDQLDAAIYFTTL